MELYDLFECKCCYENYSLIKKPFILNCGHSICSVCCNNLIFQDCCFCKKKINMKIINYSLFGFIEKEHNKILNKIKNPLAKKIYETNNIVKYIEKIKPIKLFFIIIFLSNLDKNWINKIYTNIKITSNTTFKECYLLSILLKYKKMNKLSKFLIKNNKIKNFNSEMWSGLMISSRFSNYIMVKYLVEKGANLDLQDKDGWNALMIASLYSNTDSSIDTVKYLVEKGANLDLQDKDGWNALMIASLYSNTDSSIDTVKYLVEKGANLDVQDKD